PGRPERIRWQRPLHCRIHAAGHNEHVRQTVVVQIDDARSPADESRLYADASANGEIIEVAFAIVAVQDVGVGGEMGFENIQVAVEIVVTNGDTHARLLHAVLAERDATFERLLAKRAVVLVAKEPAW